MSPGVDLFNPLPTVLAHYERELVETLGRIGIATNDVAPRPAMDDKGASKPQRLLGHLGAVRAARPRPAPMVILWPALGWSETALWVRRRSPTYLVIHDPVAIRHQHGQGGPLRAVARAAAIRQGPSLVCHTFDAAQATRDALELRYLPRVALHPLADATEDRGRREPARRNVLVAGEYKPSRDLTLLAGIGPLIRDLGMTPKIIGRGWPPVDGWEVTPEFVSEGALEAAIAQATAVVVPYTRYWQSGIAVRAVESGVPVVGLRTRFLESLLGATSPGLVDLPGTMERWSAALEAASGVGPAALAAVAAEYRADVDASWRALLTHTPAETPRTPL